MMMAALLTTAVAALAFGPNKGAKPHVLFILVDDLGHSELGYNRALTPTGSTKEVGR